MRLQYFIFSLITLGLLSFSCGSDDEPTNTPTANFEAFWNTFDQQYSYFELKNIDWDAIKTEYAPQITDNITDRQLFDTFSEIIWKLKDGHVRLQSSQGNSFYRLEPGEVDNSAVNPQQYVNITEQNNRFTIGRLKDKNVGYIAVHSLSGNIDGPEYQALYASVSSFSSYDGLIIDLRNNGGGNDAIAQRFVQSFASQSVVFRRFRFREQSSRNAFTPWQESLITPENTINFEKPIVVLTNRRVVSSAEGFTLMLKALFNVTLMGDTTAGSTGNPGAFQLPNGWELYVSRWQVTDPDGNYVEDQGIAPDQVVYITEADRNSGVDTILEAAIASFN
ncbi:MAG: hypothetical protein HEP71_15515 [Roseivirga sp.]|nr:hypothetical protein [Roseivirga sp.]